MTGMAYETAGDYGLIPLSCVPLESPEPARVSRESTTIASEPKKQWRRQGFFKNGPNAARYAAIARNDRTRIYRDWLETVLREPRPAAEVFKLAADEGIPAKAVKRAKKFHKVISVRTGGLAWRGSWVWRFPTT